MLSSSLALYIDPWSRKQNDVLGGFFGIRKFKFIQQEYPHIFSPKIHFKDSGKWSYHKYLSYGGSCLYIFPMYPLVLVF